MCRQPVEQSSAADRWYWHKRRTATAIVVTLIAIRRVVGRKRVDKGVFDGQLTGKSRRRHNSRGVSAVRQRSVITHSRSKKARAAKGEIC